jgi:hypothetical protein
VSGGGRQCGFAGTLFRATIRLGKVARAGGAKAASEGTRGDTVVLLRRFRQVFVFIVFYGSFRGRVIGGLGRCHTFIRAFSFGIDINVTFHGRGRGVLVEVGVAQRDVVAIGIRSQRFFEAYIVLGWRAC